MTHDEKIVEAVACAVFHAKPRNRIWDALPNELKNQYRKQARAAITAYQAEAWQPIETAPKDFVTDIDMWANGERLTDCSWMRPTYGPKEYAWCRHAYDDCNGPVYNEVKGATHWQPLPPAPKATP